MKLSKFYTITLIAVISFSFNINAVSAHVNVEKKSFKAQRSFDLLKKMKARTKFKEKDYRGALEIYKELSLSKPEDAKLAYRLGECYLSLKMKNDAITNLEKAYKLNNNVCKEVHLLLGKAYHLSNDLDKALAEYDAFKKSASESLQKKSELEDLIKKCNFAKEQIKNPKNVTITNIGTTVNSSYRDYAPSLNADETLLIFTSRRENTTGGGKDPNDFQFNEDIYFSVRADATQAWGTPQQISPLINTEGHDASISVAPDGQSIYLFKNDLKNGGDIYESRRGADNSWLIPKPLPATVNTPYYESSASVTSDGTALYFVSERPKGKGNGDIYKSIKDAKGDWGPAENLGSEINTEDDEIGSFISADGKTLYFSSKGHLGMGGYDIFKSVNENGKWSTPENMGYPINSTEDDVHFVKTQNGNRAYFSSIRDNKSDVDIYLINFNEAAVVVKEPEPVKTDSVVAVKEEEPVKEEKVQLLNVKGQITDEKNKGVEAQVDFSDINTGATIASVTTNKKGEYKAPLAAGKTYAISIKSAGYEEVKETIEVPKDSLANLSKKFKLKKAVKAPIAAAEAPVKSEAGSIVYFDSGSAKLKLRSSQSVLDGVLEQLKQDNNKTIEISGFSDKTGGENLNKSLSLRRAQSVANYLSKRGIKRSRIVVAGYGSAQPVAPNNTKEGRQQNRRVELSLK